MLKKLRKNIFLVIGLSAIFYVVLVLYSDFHSLKSSFIQFPIFNLILSFTLVMLGIVFKYFRWSVFCNSLNLDLKISDSILIFNSGLLMGITPGKLGELIKSFLIKRINNESVSKTSSIVVAERIVEFLALILLFFVGSTIYTFGIYYATTLLIFVAIIGLIFSNKRISEGIISFLSNISFIQKNIDNILEFKKSIKILFKVKTFFLSFILSIIAWILECYGFYIITNYFFSDISFSLITYLYCFSIIIGAISMLPGGIGTTESSLSYLLYQYNFSEVNAISSTLIIRFFSLWIPAFIGFISLVVFSKIRNKKLS